MLRSWPSFWLGVGYSSPPSRDQTSPCDWRHSAVGGEAGEEIDHWSIKLGRPDIGAEALTVVMVDGSGGEGEWIDSTRFGLLRRALLGLVDSTPSERLPHFEATLHRGPAVVFIPAEQASRDWLLAELKTLGGGGFWGRAATENRKDRCTVSGYGQRPVCHSGASGAFQHEALHGELASLLRREAVGARGDASNVGNS